MQEVIILLSSDHIFANNGAKKVGFVDNELMKFVPKSIL